MRRDLSAWTVTNNLPPGTFTFKHDNGLVFFIRGANLEDDYDDVGYTGAHGTFDSFTIDGREPTEEEKDEYSDDIRDLIYELYTQT